MLHRACLLAALGLATACGGDPPSCTLSSQAGTLACIQYASAVSESDAKASCASGGGTWQEMPCDTAGAIAQCDAFGSSTWYYPPYLSDTGATLADLQMTCEDAGGEFTPLGTAP